MKQPARSFCKELGHYLCYNKYMEVKIKKHDLTGVKFGNLTVLKLSSKTKKRNLKWRVRCDCGRTKVLTTASIKRGVQHCGCKTERNITKRHGMYGTKEYMTWARMKQRCEDKNHNSYKDYGARGITIYKPWSLDFVNFYNDIGPAPSPDYSIDRIDNNKGYYPDNVRWATKISQNNNRRSNVKVSYGNETLTIAQWAAKLNINYATLYDRIYKHKWPLERAFESYGRR